MKKCGGSFMSVTTYAILGFAMMLILTAVLVSGKFTPSIPMIVIPIIFAVIMQPCSRLQLFSLAL